MRLWNAGPEKLDMKYGGRYMTFEPNEERDVYDEMALHFLSCKDRIFAKRGLCKVPFEVGSDVEGREKIRLATLKMRLEYLHGLLRSHQIYRNENLKNNMGDPGVDDRIVGIAEEVDKLEAFFMVSKDDNRETKSKKEYFDSLTGGKYSPEIKKVGEETGGGGVAVSVAPATDVSPLKRGGNRPMTEEEMVR